MRTDKEFVRNQFKLIKNIKHINIIEAIDYFQYKDNEYIIFEYYEKDLLKLINDKEFDENIIKAVIKQMLEGLAYLHDNSMAHRDMKPDNILISPEGVVKIIDFDLTKVIDNTRPLTRGVVTLYYRAPEIFFGDIHYSFSVDMWSIGCILAEMMLKKPIFKGRNEIEVVCMIFDLLGPADVIFIY